MVNIFSWRYWQPTARPISIGIHIRVQQVIERHRNRLAPNIDLHFEGVKSIRGRINIDGMCHRLMQPLYLVMLVARTYLPMLLALNGRRIYSRINGRVRWMNGAWVVCERWREVGRYTRGLLLRDQIDVWGAIATVERWSWVQHSSRFVFEVQPIA